MEIVVDSKKLRYFAGFLLCFFGVIVLEIWYYCVVLEAVFCAVQCDVQCGRFNERDCMGRTDSEGQFKTKHNQQTNQEKAWQRRR